METNIESITEAEVLNNIKLSIKTKENPPAPPKDAPPVGKNYSYIGNTWVLIDNPVYRIVSQ